MHNYNMDGRTIFRSVVIIAILGLAVYHNSLGGKFVWDDRHLVENNTRIMSWSGISRIFAEDIGAAAGNEYNFYRPLQILTYRIDYALWRLEERGYHLTNVLLHISAALALYWLINILYDDRLLSLLTGAFFVVHPVHTEAVAYISGRADPLALMFILLCFVFYVKYIHFERVSDYLIACLSYIAALLSREGALTLPLLLLLYHYTFNKKITIKCFLPILVITSIYIFVRPIALGSTMPDLSSHPPLLERAPAFFIAIISYFRLLVLPFALHMEYGKRLFDFYEPMAILGITVVAVLLIYLFKAKKDNRLAFFSISWFMVSLLPVSGIYPMNAYMAEHWLYLPSIGVFLLLSKGLVSISRDKRFRVPAIALTSALLAFYSFLTIRQNNYWADPISLFEITLRYAPDSFKIYNNLGIAYNAAGRHEEAISSYRKALEINPDYVDTYYNLGCAYDALGKYAEASASYEKTIEMDPGYSQAYNNLGNIYIGLGKNKQAISMYKKAIEINPRYADAHYNLGNEYRRSGRSKEAIMSYKKALEINPYDGAIHNNIAVTYYYAKQYDMAIVHCDKAIELGFRPHPNFLKELEAYR